MRVIFNALILSWEVQTEDGKYSRMTPLSINVRRRKAQSFRVGQSLHDDGMYESDHRPVFADIVISGQA